VPPLLPLSSYLSCLLFCIQFFHTGFPVFRGEIRIRGGTLILGKCGRRGTGSLLFLSFISATRNSFSFPVRMNKVIHAEAQRAIDVLQTCCDLIDCVSKLPENDDDVDAIVNALEIRGCRDSAMFVKQQFMLEREFVHSFERKQRAASTVDLADRVKWNSLKLSKCLRSEKDALKILLNATSNGGDHSPIESKETDVFEIGLSSHVDVDVISRLMQGLSQVALVKLSTSVEEDHARARDLRSILQRERFLSDVKDKLEKNLESLVCRLSFEKNDREFELKSLRRELEERHAAHQNHLRVISRRKATSLKGTQEKHQKRVEDLHASLQAFQEDVYNSREDIIDIEYQSMKKMNRSCECHNEAVRQFDETMNRKRAQLKELRALYEEERMQISFLEEFFAKEDQKRDRLQREEKEFDEFVFDLEFESRRLYIAARSAQKLFRGFKGRERARQMQKKKTKNPKKGTRKNSPAKVELVHKS